MPLFAKHKSFSNATGSRHRFDSIANIDEAPTKDSDTEYLQQQLSDIALAATADKEHIQQMLTVTNDLLALIKQQQQQIMALTKQNGDLIAVLAKFDATKGTTDTAALPKPLVLPK